MPLSFRSLFFPWSFGFQVFHPSDHHSAKFPLLLSPCNVTYGLSCPTLSPSPLSSLFCLVVADQLFIFPSSYWWVEILASSIILFLDLSLARHYTFYTSVGFFPSFLFGILLLSVQQLSYYCPHYNVL